MKNHQYCLNAKSSPQLNTRSYPAYEDAKQNGRLFIGELQCIIHFTDAAYKEFSQEMELCFIPYIRLQDP